METTIKGAVDRKANSDGSIDVSYKRYSLFLGLLTIVSFALVIPLCFVLVGFVLLPIPIVLLVLFYIVQVSDKFTVIPGQGVVLKKHKIDFKDMGEIETRTSRGVARGIAHVVANVKGKDVVLASLVREPVATELLSIVDSHA